MVDFFWNFNFKLINYLYFFNMIEEEDWDVELEGGGIILIVIVKFVYDVWNNLEC